MVAITTSSTTSPDNFHPPAVPKNRMTSTWTQKPPSQWNFWERTLIRMNAAVVPVPVAIDAVKTTKTTTTTMKKKEQQRTAADDDDSSADNNNDDDKEVPPAESVYKKPPVFAYTDPVPVYSVLSQHLWVFPRAMAPLLVNVLFTKLTGLEVSAWIAAPLYLGYQVWYGTDLFGHLQRMTAHYGHFDGSKPRDGIPDIEVTNVAVGLFAVVTLRALFGFSWLYASLEGSQADMINLRWAAWLPVNCFFFAVAIDFWFYWYHRAMHEVPFLWRFHRKHHTTKHPIAALGSFADHEQELFDMLLIPVLAYTVWPLDFATWWVSACYTLYLEASGHSGLRAHFTNPTTWPLAYLGCSLVIEDHDLHHRKGWGKATNYGKQTLLWDTLFGSKGERVEGVEDNVDWNQNVQLL